MDYPPSNPPFRVDFAAGATAAVIGALSFSIFHSLWIVHVPTVYAESVLHATVAALALAWAMRVTRPTIEFGRRVQDGLLLGSVLWLSLVPYEVVGAFFGPLSFPTSLTGFLKLTWIMLLGPPVGAVFGWTLTRRSRPTIAWAVAVLAVNTRIGGGLTGFRGRGVLFALFLWLLPTYLLAGMALVGTYAAARGRIGKARATA